jgi:hypothetical protein
MRIPQQLDPFGTHISTQQSSLLVHSLHPVGIGDGTVEMVVDGVGGLAMDSRVEELLGRSSWIGGDGRLATCAKPYASTRGAEHKDSSQHAVANT